MQWDGVRESSEEFSRGIFAVLRTIFTNRKRKISRKRKMISLNATEENKSKQNMSERNQKMCNVEPKNTEKNVQK